MLVNFEPVGRWFESRDRHVRLLSGSSDGGGGEESEEEEREDGSGEEVNPLLLDPTQWRVRVHIYSLPFFLCPKLASYMYCIVGNVHMVQIFTLFTPMLIS